MDEEQQATTGAPDLRGKRKAATRRALQDAALALFAEIGYDATTVTLIASRAGVAERTLFTHFPSKEDILFVLRPEDIAALEEAVAAAPATLADLDALERAIVDWHNSPDVGIDETDAHETARLLVRAASSSATLRGKQLDYSEELARAAARGLARRAGLPAPHAQQSTIADIAVRILHHAITEWVEAPVGAFDEIWTSRLAMVRASIGPRERPTDQRR